MAAGGAVVPAPTAAIAAVVLALVTSDIWPTAPAGRASPSSPSARWSPSSSRSSGAQLWERPRSRRVREQVVLFDVATTPTVVIGVLTLRAVLFLLAPAGSLLLVVRPLFVEGLGHPAALPDHLEPAWPTCSLETVDGALGAGLESADAVREAACTYRSQQPAH